MYVRPLNWFANNQYLINLLHVQLISDMTLEHQFEDGINEEVNDTEEQNLNRNKLFHHKHWRMK